MTLNPTIIADEHLLNVETLFGHHGKVIRTPSQKITSAILKDADLLLVRSVTSVNEKLLKNSAVQWVGTATAGTDHLDLDWLNKAHIAWAHAPGANANAVASYVMSCVKTLQKNSFLNPEKRKAAVVGVGQIGSLVSQFLQQRGFTVAEIDPPRVEREPSFQSAPLEVLMDADLICLHTPLTFSTKNKAEKIAHAALSPYPTYHLLNQFWLERLKPGAILLNAGRGGVLDEKALLKTRPDLVLCCDVWENEPDINLALLERAFIATPHIAGYTVKAKERLTQLLYEKACQYFGWIPQASTVRTKKERKLTAGSYDPLTDTALLKTSKNFEKMRRHYPLREE